MGSVVWVSVLVEQGITFLGVRKGLSLVMVFGFGWWVWKV